MKLLLNLRFARLPLVLFVIFLCTVEVKSSDLFFAIHCPDDITVDCEAEIWNLSQYGYAYVKDYSGKRYLYNPEVKYNINYGCMNGSIKRTWKVYDYQGNKHKCSQTIFVESKKLEEDSIHWPIDFLEIEGCNPDVHPNSLPYGYGYPKVYSTKCNLVGISYSDLNFHFEGSCKKIVRKWQVIDWCNYNPNSRRKTAYYYYQVLKIFNSEIPDVYVPSDTTITSFDCKGAEVILDPLIIGENSCGDEFEIWNDSPYSYNHGADASGRYPIGETSIKFTIKYGCGYNKTFKTHIYVEDKSAPIPVCITTLSTSLMPIFSDTSQLPVDGMVDIVAHKFNLKSYHPCEEQELSFSFSIDKEDTTRMFSCGDLGYNDLQMWVTDNQGNQASCFVELFVSEGSALISGCQIDSSTENHEDTIITANLSGNVSDYLTGEPISNVSVFLMELMSDTIYATVYDTSFVEVIVDSFQNQGGAWLYILGYEKQIVERQEMITMSIEKSEKTNNLGHYILSNLSIDDQQMVRLAYKSQQADKKSITTDDAKALLDHLSGTNPISDSILLMAADVNGSGDVTYDDANVLLMYLFGNIEKLPVENEWIFVPTQTAANSEMREFGNNEFELIMHESTNYFMDFDAIQLGKLSSTQIEGRNSPDYLMRKLRKLQEKGYQNSQPNFYPNPIGESLKIQFELSDNSVYQFEMYNGNGSRVLDYRGSAISGTNQTSISTAELVAGIYFYRFRVLNNVFHGKLIKSQ